MPEPIKPVIVGASRTPALGGGPGAPRADDDLLAGLNEPQREAVTYRGPALLIVAGAGSGKTSVLTRRIAFLLAERGVRPGEILAITFTNKAANELKDRLERMLGEESRDVWAATFHSACVRILRRDIDKLGFDRSFTIYDTDDTKRVLKDILKELELDEKTFPVREIQTIISRSKDDMILPEEFAAQAEKSQDWRRKRIGKVYALYNQKLRDANALDFDDIILHTVDLLRTDRETLAYYQRKFR